LTGHCQLGAVPPVGSWRQAYAGRMQKLWRSCVQFLTQRGPGQPRMPIPQPCNHTRSGPRVSAVFRPPPGGMDAVYNHITTAMRERTSMQGRAAPMEPGTPGACTARVVPMRTVAVILIIRAAAFWSASAMRPALPTFHAVSPIPVMRAVHEGLGSDCWCGANCGGQGRCSAARFPATAGRGNNPPGECDHKARRPDATTTRLAPRLTILPPDLPPNGTGRPMATVHKQGQKSRSERPWSRSSRPAGTVPHLPGNDTPALTWDFAYE
jgi:hypothetical protein